MGRKNKSRGNKRKSSNYNIKLQTAPPTKRRMSPPTYKKMSSWFCQTSQTPEIIGIEQANSPCEIGTAVLEAEIHPVPAESFLDTEDKDNNNHTNNDPIYITLNIAKEAISVKNYIRCIENSIMHTQNTQQGNIIPFYTY